jgi:FkbM family methyltransferase
MSLDKGALKRIIAGALPARFLVKLKKTYYLRAVRSFWEKDFDVIRNVVKRGSYVIDIGANVGWYTRVFAELVGDDGRVYGIEPIPDTYEILTYVMRKLRHGNVQLSNCAISDKVGSVLMEVPLYDYGGENFYQSRIVQEGSNEEYSLRRYTVRTDTIDSMFLDVAEMIAFVKCDVEGHEYCVIKGAEEFLKRSKPIWLMEIGGDPDEEDSRAKQLLDVMDNYGYAPYLFVKGSLTRRLPGDRSINYYFLHESHLDKVGHMMSPDVRGAGR